VPPPTRRITTTSPMHNVRSPIPTLLTTLHSMATVEPSMMEASLALIAFALTPVRNQGESRIRSDA